MACNGSLPIAYRLIQAPITSRTRCSCRLRAKLALIWPKRGPITSASPGDGDAGLGRLNQAMDSALTYFHMYGWRPASSSAARVCASVSRKLVAALADHGTG